MKTKKQLDKPINFDDFASNYENYIAQSFGSIDNNLNYYHSSKAKILKKELKQNPKKILDFGCGVGLMLSHLKEVFKESKFYAYDDSQKSLDYIKANYKDVNCINNLDMSIKFNLIFVSNVIHHVKSADRKNLFKKIYELLDDNGRLFIIEHNPYNPLTLRTVANCAFDADAELIKKKDLINLCKKNNFKIEESGYIHFFPSKLDFLFKFEFYLKWLFLGAQYFCIFKK